MIQLDTNIKVHLERDGGLQVMRVTLVCSDYKTGEERQFLTALCSDKGKIFVERRSLQPSVNNALFEGQSVPPSFMYTRVTN